MPKYKRVRVDGRLVNAVDSEGKSITSKTVLRGYRYYLDGDGNMQRTPALEADTMLQLETRLNSWVNGVGEAENKRRLAIQIASALRPELAEPILKFTQGRRSRKPKPGDEVKHMSLWAEALELARRSAELQRLQQTNSEHEEVCREEEEVALQLAEAKESIPQTVGWAVSYWLLTLSADENMHPPTRTYYVQLMSDYVLVPFELGKKAIGDYTLAELQDRQLAKEVFQDLERSLRRERISFESIGFQDYLAGNQTPKVQAKRRKMSTGYKVLDTLSQALQWVVFESEIGLFRGMENPLKSYDRLYPKPRKAKRIALRGDEFQRLVSAAESHGMPQLVPLLALVRHGFRPSEARALRWSDRIGDTNKWKVVGSIIRNRGEVWVERTKTTDGDTEAEHVTFSKSTVELLEQYRAPGCDYVVSPFPGSRKTFMTLTTYTERFSRLRVLAEIEGREEKTIYMLKHGLISELIRAGVSVDQIVLMTRHTSFQMVRQIYNDISSDDLAEAIDNLDAARSAPKTNVR
ncbi:MAG: tyrosine-type recombinase/integrase [Fimbriimonadaceae bacterium]|nr:tyrosine-type recombinase/integrase [Fimbriimonadaceae bacterium]